MTAPIQLERVSRRYGEDPGVDALIDVDLRVEEGEWVAIVGPSGSGKSTLLNVLGLLDRATAGSFRLEGIDVETLSDRQRAGLRSRRIGFVFQAFHLLSHRPVVENVMMAEVYRDRPRAGRRERAAAALERVGLGHRLDFLPVHLSGGERQRTAIARALVGSPAMLLCDEPTGNLDSKTTEGLLSLFQEINAEGMTIVMITHDPNVARHASRQVRIIDGRVSGDEA